MIYKFLNSKYKINRKIGSDNERSVFSAKMIFSSELALNVLTFLGIIHLTFFEKEISKETFTLAIVTSFVIPLIIVFKFFNSEKIINSQSNITWNIISISYSIITYVLGFYVITNLRA